MLEIILKELVSTVRWMLIISFVAGAYYIVTPKYVGIKEGEARLNQVTGYVYEAPKEFKIISTFNDVVYEHGAFWHMHHEGKIIETKVKQIHLEP